MMVSRRAPPIRNIFLSMLRFVMINGQLFLKFKRELLRTRIPVSLWDGDDAGREVISRKAPPMRNGRTRGKPF